MKRVILTVSIFIIITSTIFAIFLINESKEQTALGTNKTNESKEKTTLETNESNNLEVISVKTDNLSKLFIRNNITGEEKFFIELSDIYYNQRHYKETHNGNLYIFRRVNGDDGSFNDELWRYSIHGEKKKLYSGKDLVDFLVSDDEKFIAVEDSVEKSVELKDYSGEKSIAKIDSLRLSFLNQEGKVLKKLSKDEFEGVSHLGMLGWAGDSFWCDSTEMDKVERYYQINNRSWELKTCYLLEGGVLERALNLEQGLLAYSNYPGEPDYFYLTNPGADKQKIEVNLYIKNLFTDEKKVIATSLYPRHFSPRWLDKNTLEYDHPNGEGRVKIKID